MREKFVRAAVQAALIGAITLSTGIALEGRAKASGTKPQETVILDAPDTPPQCLLAELTPTGEFVEDYNGKLVPTYNFEYIIEDDKGIISACYDASDRGRICDGLGPEPPGGEPLTRIERLGDRAWTVAGNYPWAEAAFFDGSGWGICRDQVKIPELPIHTVSFLPPIKPIK